MKLATFFGLVAAPMLMAQCAPACAPAPPAPPGPVPTPLPTGVVPPLNPSHDRVTASGDVACHLGSPIFSVTVRWTWEPDADTVLVREAINGYWDLNHVVTDRTVTEYRFYNLWHQNPRADDQAKIDGEVDQYSGGSAGTLLRADATQPPSTMIPVPDCSATQPS